MKIQMNCEELKMADTSTRDQWRRPAWRTLAGQYEYASLMTEEVITISNDSINDFEVFAISVFGNLFTTNWERMIYNSKPNVDVIDTDDMKLIRDTNFETFVSQLAHFGSLKKSHHSVNVVQSVKFWFILMNWFHPLRHFRKRSLSNVESVERRNIQGQTRTLRGGTGKFSDRIW